MGKRIVFTSNSTWATYNFRKDLVVALRQQGYEIIIASPYDAYSKELVKLGFEFRDLDIDRKGVNPIRDIKLFFDIFWLYKEVNPFMVFHYSIKPNIYGTLAAKLCRIKSVCVLSGLGYVFLNHNLVSRIARLLYRISIAFSYRVWFLNEDDRCALIENGMVRLSKTDVLPGEGIDTNYFSPFLFSTKKKLYDFILIGRLLRDKGIYEYVEAAGKVKKECVYEVKFGLAGPIDLNPSSISMTQINQWVMEGLVDYLGNVNDVRNVIASSGCVVLPSYREGLPRVLLEASSMSKPVITTDVSGCKDVVDHQITGLVCEPKNADDLFHAIKNILRMSCKRKEEMGSAGREKIIEKYSNELVIKKYLEFLKNSKLFR